MGTLKRQAAKAERYGQIREELREKLRVALASRVALLDAEQTATTGQIAALTVGIDAQVAQVEALDAEHGAGVETGYALDQQIREYASAANQSAVELERIAARTAANADRVAELTARLATGAEELEAARAQLTALSGEREQQRSFLDSANAEADDSRADAVRRQQSALDAVRAVQSREQQAELTRRGAMQLMTRVGQIKNEQGQAEASLAGLERESERLIAESKTAREELATLGLQQGQVRMSFETVSERLKRVEMEISELRLGVEASRTEESETKRRGDQLRGEVASLQGREGSIEGLIRDHSYSTDTVKNIFKIGARQRAEGAGHAGGFSRGGRRV
jgi:chromosome segregation protein